jgi:hypothetical protein
VGELNLPVLLDSMTVVDALAKLRQSKSRAGVRSIGYELYELLTAADLAAAIDDKATWKSITVSEVPRTKREIIGFRVARDKFDAEFAKVRDANFAFAIERVPVLEYAEGADAAAATAPETLTVITRQEPIANAIIYAARICRCREAFHDVPPTECSIDGSPVDCT